MPDAFEDWLTGLDVAEVMEFAEDWGAKEYEKGCLTQQTKLTYYQ